MLKVVSLDTKAGRRQEVVEMAKFILAEAEAGRLVDLSYAAALADGGIRTGYTGTDDAPRRLAGVSRLLHRLHATMDEQAR